jgi:glutathione S-transferase
MGGKFRWDLINCDGKEVTTRASTAKIVPGKKIVFTWKDCDDELWENQISIVTVEFSDPNSGTELRLKHEQLPGEESRDGHNRGWNSMLDRLEKFVTR